ncbi:hypothetical protein FHG87_022601 [Trinorchestia longiramus]|nr:hypothetical protein FHG87_022601 [Trinorchestia longiramus]
MDADKEDNSADSLHESEGAKLENLISSLGQFGRYQRYVLFMSSIGSFMPAMVVVAMTFLAYEPAHRCQIPQCEPELASTVYNRTFLNFTTPYEVNEGRWSRCERYKFELEVIGDAPDLEECLAPNFLNQVEECGPGHVFDNSVFRSTTITDVSLKSTSVQGFEVCIR